MKNKSILTAVLILFGLLSAVHSFAAAPPSVVRITGAVRHPMSVKVQDLAKFEHVDVRTTEVTHDGKFHGVFTFRGVPLKTLLDISHIEKEQKDFSKPVDLAILVRNKSGKQVVLSWGEIMYRNPADVILAYDATPIKPHHPVPYEKASAREKDWQDQLKRAVVFPKLVLENDFYTDRALEDVVHIEVVDLKPILKTDRKKHLFSSRLSIVSGGKTLAVLDDLAKYAHAEVMTKPVGDGTGYHGLQLCSGVPLARVIEKTGVGMTAESAVLVSAVDGYRSLLSYGELFLSSGGANILLTDGADGKPLEKYGKFYMMPTGDLAADRYVKAVDKIEIVDLKRHPKVIVISTGCADARLITLEALHAFAKADVFVCTEDQKARFATYIGGRPILFDYFKFELPDPVCAKELKNLTADQRDKLRRERAAEAVKIIKAALDEGKTVAILEYGDPSIYGSFRHMTEVFRQQNIAYQVVPGISAFNAANAAIGKEMAGGGSVVLSTFWGLKENEAALRTVAKSGDTLVLFMGLKDAPGLVDLLKKYYAASTPVNVVYNAGSDEKSRVYKTTVGDALSVIGKVDEKWLGMIYVGPGLKD